MPAGDLSSVHRATLTSPLAFVGPGGLAGVSEPHYSLGLRQGRDVGEASDQLSAVSDRAIQQEESGLKAWLCLPG